MTLHKYAFNTPTLQNHLSTILKQKKANEIVPLGNGRKFIKSN